MSLPGPKNPLLADVVLLRLLQTQLPSLPSAWCVQQQLWHSLLHDILLSGVSGLMPSWFLQGCSPAKVLLDVSPGVSREGQRPSGVL